MLDLFTNRTYYTKFISLTCNPVIEKIILKQYDIYKDYYKDKNFFVDNKNPFVSILNNIIPSDVENKTKEELYFYVKNNIEYLSNVIGCTSNRNKGKIFEDRNLRYIILLDNIDNNIINKDYDIIKVLYTDYEVLDFSYNVEEEFMILSLNPTEMVLDYLDWEKERIKYGLTYSFNIYVHTRLIPKIWKTKMNFVIFNRFMNLYYNIENKKFKNKLPIQIINTDNILDNELRRILKLTTINKKLDIRTFLNSFKFFNIKLNDILNFDNYIFTSTTYWIVWLSRIEYIRFFLDLSRSTDSDNTNNDYIKDLFVEIKRFQNRNTTMIKLPEDLYFNFNIDYDYIKEKINYR